MTTGQVGATIEAIDLFCGAGGLSYGLLEAGHKVVAGLDIDGKCEFPFTENIGAKFLKEDLTKTDPDVLLRMFSNGALKLLAGCAPCQPFSTLRNGSKRESSKKWPLLNEFARVAEHLQPDFITMENVPVLRTQSIFEDFINTLDSLDYHITHAILDAADYGVPQRRRRLVLLASRYGPIKILTPQELDAKPTTVRDAIGHLPKLESGETDPADVLHRARRLTPLNVQRMKASKPGGTWNEWPEDLRLECHKRSTGSTFRSVYGRMEWDKPSSTMTTQSFNVGTGRYGHPEQDRGLTLREMAILQSFPENYKFVPNESVPEFASVGRLIGNAVPVQLGYVIGKSLSAHLSALGGDLNVKQA
ncbi:DNA cytosine methyltransferase [Brucella tritici]|uniref:DNA cytosine methyltransferase n=1 Tax=Brucella tritici TaxID=94626 RepID=UPI003D6D4E3D